MPLKLQVRTASGGYISSVSIISSLVLTRHSCGSLSDEIHKVNFTTRGLQRPSANFQLK